MLHLLTLSMRLVPIVRWLMPMCSRAGTFLCLRMHIKHSIIGFNPLY